MFFKILTFLLRLLAFILRLLAFMLTFLFWLFAFSGVGVEDRRVRVRGYYRKDGTYVRPHYRTAPDSLFSLQVNFR